MNTNLEIKIKVENLIQIEKKLSQFSCQEFHQKDTYIKYPNGRLKLRDYKDGKKQLIFYKRKNSSDINKSLFKIHTYKNKSKYLEAYENFKTNFGVKGEVEKNRKYYRIGTCRIHLDRVKDLGGFVEIESVVKNNTTIEKNMIEINKIIVDFIEINPTKKISKSYIDLLTEKA